MKSRHPAKRDDAAPRRSTLPASSHYAGHGRSSQPPAESFPQAPKTHAALFTLAGPHQGAVHPLHGTTSHIGREPEMEVRLDDDAVSGKHAHVVHRSDGYYLVDDGSRNGTYLNQHRVTTPQLLRDGDHVRFGNTVVRFSLLDELEERALTNLFELTVRDALTRAYNRRFLMTHLRSELAFSARQGMWLALLLVDIDHFKHFNDTYGHPVGDVVLQMVASTIQRMLRPYDVLCRFGGEEFVIVARDTSLRNAEILAERVRHNVESTTLQLRGTTDRVTVSVGVAAIRPWLPDGAEADALLVAVDAALYRAKEGGRNRVHVSPPLGPSTKQDRALRHTTPPRVNQASEAEEPANDYRPPALPRFN